MLYSFAITYIHYQLNIYSAYIFLQVNYITLLCNDYALCIAFHVVVLLQCVWYLLGESVCSIFVYMSLDHYFRCLQPDMLYSIWPLHVLSIKYIFCIYILTVAKPFTPSQNPKRPTGDTKIEVFCFFVERYAFVFMNFCRKRKQNNTFYILTPLHLTWRVFLYNRTFYFVWHTTHASQQTERLIIFGLISTDWSDLSFTIYHGSGNNCYLLHVFLKHYSYVIIPPDTISEQPVEQ